MLEVKDRILESGIDLHDLAKKSGIALFRIEAILRGQDFTVAEMLAISKCLKLQPNDFISKNETHQKAEMLFRNVTSSKHSPESAIQRFSSHISNSINLLSHQDDPLEWLSLFEVKTQDFEAAEWAAYQFRYIFYREDMVSPIPQLPSICTEKLKILLYVVPEKVDGASAIYGKNAYIFLANRSFKPRMLFTLAHELGHLVAGHHGSENVANIDEDTDGLTRQKKHLEAFADAFASSLLMPAKGVGIALKKIKELGSTNNENIGDVELLYLARIFAVSFEAAARRCEDLQLLPKGGALALYNHVVEHYGSPERRAELLDLPPRVPLTFPFVPSSLVEEALEQIRAGELSVGKAANMLSMSIPQLYSYNATGRTEH
jgi:Zn-dependent peptidase ImmA (M78 family)